MKGTLPNRQKQITLIGDTSEESIKFINKKIDNLIWKKGLHISDDEYLIGALKKYNVIPGDLEKDKVDDYVKNAMNQLLNKQDDRARFYSYFAMAVYEAKTRRETPGFPPARSQVSLTLSNIFRFFQFFAEDCEAYINEKTQMRSLQPKHHTQKKTFDIIHMDNYNPSGNNEQSSSPYMNFKSEYVKRECENILRIAKFKEQNLNNGKPAEQQKTINVLISVPLCFDGSGTDEETDPTAAQMQATILETYRQILSDDRAKGENSLYKNIRLLFLSSLKTTQERNLINTINNMNGEEKKQFDIFDYNQPGTFPTNTKDNKEHLIYCHPGDVKYWFGNENTPSFLSKDFNTTAASAETFFRYTNFIDYILPGEQRGYFDNTHHDYRANKNVKSVDDFTQRMDFQFLMPNGQVEICSKENAPWLQDQKLLNFNENNKKIQNNNPKNPPQNVPDYDKKGKISNPKLLLKSGNEIDIIKLANDPDNDGYIFEKKNSCWSWWVFPSFSGSRAELNFENNSPIYKNIIEDKDMLNAYSKVLRKITNEIYRIEENTSRRKETYNLYNNIDFIKAITCFNRIQQNIMNFNKNSNELNVEQRQFIKEFLNFSLAMKTSNNQLAFKDVFAKKEHFYSDSQYGETNLQTLAECHSFSNTFRDHQTAIYEELIDEILSESLCPLDLQNQEVDLKVDFSNENKDQKFNNGNTCFFHTAITTLAYIPFFKEALKDYIDADIKKDQIAERFIKAYYNYITTGEGRYFQDMSAIFNNKGQQHDAYEAIDIVMDFLSRHLRVNIFKIFSCMTTTTELIDENSNRVSSPTRDYANRINLCNETGKNNDLQSLWNSYFNPEQITGYNSGKTQKQVNVTKQTAFNGQPPILMLQTKPYGNTGSQTYDKDINLKVFTNTINIGGDTYVPFVCGNHYGSINSGHWIAYGNSIENLLKKNKQIRCHDDNIAYFLINKEKTFDHPEVIFLYNATFFEKLLKNKEPLTIGSVINRMLNELDYDTKTFLIKHIMSEKNDNTVDIAKISKPKPSIAKKKDSSNSGSGNNDEDNEGNENNNQKPNIIQPLDNIISLPQPKQIEKIISSSSANNIENENIYNIDENNAKNTNIDGFIQDKKDQQQDIPQPKQIIVENPPGANNYQKQNNNNWSRKNLGDQKTKFTRKINNTQSALTINNNKNVLNQQTTTNILSTTASRTSLGNRGPSISSSSITSGDIIHGQMPSTTNQQNTTNSPINNNNVPNTNSETQNQNNNDKNKQTSYIVPIMIIATGAGAIIGGVLLRNNKIALIALCASGGVLILFGAGLTIKKSLSKNQQPQNNLADVNNNKGNNKNL